LDIAIIAGVRFTTIEPHAGGMERHTDVLARALHDLGHCVTVYAGCADDPIAHDAPYECRPLVEQRLELSAAARQDVSMPPEHVMIEHDAYLHLERLLQRTSVDVVHNNSLHYLPVVSEFDMATVHTLHTPPTPWLESAHRLRLARLLRGERRSHVVSVSHSNAVSWGGAVDSVIPNGIDLDRWPLGPGHGGYVAWSGRLVPEKAPHLAIDAARAAGRPIVLAGPAHDPDYFEREIRPRLGDGCDWVGHRTCDELAGLLGHAEVALVTPQWDEPFGLVVAEALACGTPVAAFARGAMAELIDDTCGALAADGDVDGLAAAIDAAATCDRTACRRIAEQRFSARAMATAYERLYATLTAGGTDDAPSWAA
jgi:glycosyltransferase involved in cell wall biosynthesis